MVRWQLVHQTSFSFDSTFAFNTSSFSHFVRLKKFFVCNDFSLHKYCPFWRVKFQAGLPLGLKISSWDVSLSWGICVVWLQQKESFEPTNIFPHNTITMQFKICNYDADSSLFFITFWPSHWVLKLRGIGVVATYCWKTG